MRLHDLGTRFGTDKATKHRYLDAYQQRIPAAPTVVVELGVLDGASLRMWQAFYPDVEVHGFDITAVAVSGATVHVEDAYTLEAVDRFDRIGLLVDDGPHTLASQLFTAAVWAPRADVTIIEDIPDERWLPILTAALPGTVEVIDCRDVGSFDSLAVVCTS